jgi:hypothetical protein
MASKIPGVAQPHRMSTSWPPTLPVLPANPRGLGLFRLAPMAVRRKVAAVIGHGPHPQPEREPPICSAGPPGSRMNPEMHNWNFSALLDGPVIAGQRGLAGRVDWRRWPSPHRPACLAAHREPRRGTRSAAVCVSLHQLGLRRHDVSLLSKFTPGLIAVGRRVSGSRWICTYGLH